MHNIGEDDEANPPENIKHTGMEMWKHICSLSGALGSAYIKTFLVENRSSESSADANTIVYIL